MVIQLSQVAKLKADLKAIRNAKGLHSKTFGHEIGLSPWQDIEAPTADPTLNQVLHYAESLDVELILGVAPELPPGAELVTRESDRKIYALYDFAYARHQWGWNQERVCLWLMKGYKVSPSTLTNWGLHVPKKVHEAWENGSIPWAKLRE